MERISPALARRIALAAQGFGRPRPAEVGTRQLRSAVERLAVLQLDSVNVFERSHYLPLLARLGPYDKTLLDRLTFGGRSPFVEYWAHQASLVPVSDWPLWRWRQEEFAAAGQRPGSWSSAHQPMLAFLRAELADRGPMTASDVEHEANTRTGPWWGWSDVKRGLEVLLLRGEVVAAGRTNFQRSYDLVERRIPADLLAQEVPRSDAIRSLVLLSLRAHGIGTVRDVADYFRLPQADTRRALADLVEEGSAVAAEVAGWNRPAFLDPQARRPRRIETMALLSPFDPVVWERERALRMFGFHYRIEIYTPAPRRQFGYYTLPLLQDDALVGRLDLKNDRQARVLRVQSAWREDGAAVDLDRLRDLLVTTAWWQSAESIQVADRGDLARDLAAAVVDRI